jgi:curved DNA-binding protein
MADTDVPNHYETLQVSPRADLETIQRVFRHLAKRFHPDNAETGDPERFKRLVDSFEVLSDPEQRARYDIRYAEVVEHAWRVFDQETALDDVAADRRMRDAFLSILYTACRSDAQRPGMGEVELERLLGCPEVHMRFHVWYLRENGWIRRTENGMLAITASGVDRVLDMGGPAKAGVHLLDSGDDKGGHRRAGGAGRGER